MRPIIRIRIPTVNPHTDTGIRDNLRMDKYKMRQIVGANIERARKAVGLETQPQLAKKAKIGQSSISRIENCESSPTVDMLVQIGNAVGLEPWELLANDEATRETIIRKMIMGPRISNERAAEHLPPAPRTIRRHPREPSRGGAASPRRRTDGAGPLAMGRADPVRPAGRVWPLPITQAEKGPMRFIAAIAASAALCCTAEPATVNVIGVLGAGNMTCAAYTAHRQKKVLAETSGALNWVMGFVAAYNYYFPVPVGTAKPVELGNAQSVELWLNQYCIERPGNILLLAASQLVESGGGRRAYHNLK
jgi:transcriptional regulator with XRE-family HTH domain